MDLKHYHSKVVQFTGRPCAKQLLDAFKKIKKIKKRIRVLDLGCGDGVIMLSLLNQKIIPSDSIIGVDNSDIRIKSAKILTGNRVQIKKGSATNLPFVDRSFDLVYSLMVMEHIEDDHKFVGEIYRVIKPKGMAVVSTVIKKSWGISWYRRNRKFILDPTHVREYLGIDELTKIFKQTGFRSVKCDQVPISFSFLELFFRFLISIRLISPAFSRTIFERYALLDRWRYRIVVRIPGYYAGWIVCEK